MTMKSVLISIAPKWCEKIANGEKTIELRKNRPKLETPFKCYIYQNNTGWGYPILRSLGEFVLLDILDAGKGKVIGEFICDGIEEIGAANSDRISIFSCVSKQDMWKYAKPKSMYDLKAWRISDLKVYDQPKELSEFSAVCKYINDDGTCPTRKVSCSYQQIDYNQDGSINLVECGKKIERPPQSWCYVEEL